MTDYTEVDDNDLLPGEPWTSSKAFAALRNPAAITEGAVGAPRVQSLGTAVPVTLVTTNPSAEMLNMGDYATARLRGNGGFIASSSGAINFQYGLSDDNGVSWGSWITVGIGTVASTTEYRTMHVGVDVDLTGYDALRIRWDASAPTLTYSSLYGTADFYGE